MIGAVQVVSGVWCEGVSKCVEARESVNAAGSEHGGQRARRMDAVL